MTRGSDKDMKLGLEGFRYMDLYRPERLRDLLVEFDAYLENSSPELFGGYQQYRETRGVGLGPTAVSDIVVRVAPYVGAFLARLFNIEDERDAEREQTRRDFDAIFSFRRDFVAKVDKRFPAAALEEWDLERLHQDVALLQRTAYIDIAHDPDPERALSLVAGRLLALLQAFETESGADEQAVEQVASIRESLHLNAQASQSFADALAHEAPAQFLQSLLEQLYRWTYACLHHPACMDQVSGWVSFKNVKRLDFSQLVEFDELPSNGFRRVGMATERQRARDGFALTDTRFSEREVLFEVDHCIYCHDRDRDSCSKGMRKKDGTLRENPLGVTLTGCPLEEKISEAHIIKREGDNIAALAVIMIDNPMCPGTGHRICNDCMKGCIYQKVEPVNIPQIETNILTDVLFMSFGFEIYALLTRWNPLNVKRPYALPYNGHNVLVVGLGPAGYTLAHYLANEGFAVVGVDAFKLEPLPRELIGSADAPPTPVRDFRALYEDLDKRVMAGFGGVAEYGITVRWDKNFLKVIYLCLMRRHSFSCYGGIRFGGTLAIDDAWSLGFHHIAIASGAGKPTLIGLKNNLIRGVRKASDFLMALQLTGAAKRSSMASLQVRLPAGVIGGGLTAIDTATEVKAYYPIQVEKILHRYEHVVEEFGETAVRKRFDTEELEILDEFLDHARAVHAERDRAANEHREPRFEPLVEQWGGVTLFYRKGLNDSPAYRQNHEEVEKGLEEGIVYAPGMNPTEAIADEYGHLAAVRFERLEDQDGRWVKTGEEPVVAMRSLFVAAGTSPNTIYENEYPGSFELEEKFFRRFEPQWNGAKTPELVATHDTTVPKVGKPAPFTSYAREGKYISFFGDNHPVYAGNVVKAMASAKDGYPYITRLFRDAIKEQRAADQPRRDAALLELHARLDDQLLATVVEMNRLTPTIIEVVARAPMQARKFHPGQFYRIQNLETDAQVIEDTCLSAEGLALTGAWVHKEDGLISLIALEMGTSTKLCALWKPGEQIVVMGPTGAPTEIPSGQDIALVGGGLGNAVLFSIGKAMRAAGSRVVYFAGYRKPGDVFKVEDIQAAADVIVWAVDDAPGVTPIRANRPQDKSFVGNMVEAMEAYATGQLGETPIRLQDVDELMVIGSDRMMAAVKTARHGRLSPYLKPGHVAVGSINSSMQCMMKGICAQCLCRHVDPETGEESFVYSCFNQDQDLDRVDFSNLAARLRQNSVQEKLSDLWLDHILHKTQTVRA